MTQLKLDHHRTPGSTGSPFLSSVKLLCSMNEEPQILRANGQPSND